MAMDQFDRRKLALILGRLGSDFDGEIVAAGRAASTLLREAGTTWFLAPAPALPEPTCHREIESDDDAIEYALDCRHWLTDWEANFCRSIAEQFQLSPKQRAVLARIVERVRRAEARAG